MRIAFPSTEKLGLDSPVYAHFGSAPYFVIVDADGGDVETVENKDLHHLHGNCQPLRALGGISVDAVVVGGIGRGALTKLNQEGIVAYRAVEGSVSENLALIKNDGLPRFNIDQTCQGHGRNGECIH
ncbi:NifB/NifX family molybdenum-iron cluster-binding protein [Desulfococcus multivorans]|uniref:Dinitrogenase iron-molybdenum cofactor biosynthesis protein n=1 Tax=Desulfococcus multivorans DSM 2059 TaxID=1121405 RepID=S7U0I7_DESML|nr:NifB/NifX family molybdenum-iron cluster-binding protein [Desulfococcus multivorans]AOY58818.1 dinitrogenase iron-molybdenum cofactor biosynthesis [Desulfococcus multivorans]AQV01104.1 diguanylate cyclase [Desulfococcus multivorans]EPR42941.1 Dinitrogenase iron-molybdenum cofactor biosynthesis protein [Desulfococcus multivorans DSM 2059]SJZ50937.1 Predicted Fe-Mo cluster-binding protein, NifX family [Desulfococcus multivorans DSM 2059]